MLLCGAPSVEQSYQVQVANLGISERVRFVGHLEHNEVAQLLNASHVFVLPSFEEPFGLVLLEALACGCRVIAANQAGPAEFVPSELRVSKDALLIPGLGKVDPESNDAARYEVALANAINIQLQKPLSIHERRRISATVALLCWETYVDRLLSEYDRLLRNQD